jgi:hypothetical protein
MALKKSEKLLMAGAGSIVFMFVVNQFICTEKTQTEQPVNRTVQQASIDQPVSANRNIHGKTVRHYTDHSGRIKYTNWGTDPFLAADRLVDLDSTATDSNGFVLRGIIWKGNDAHALIGDLIFQEGERIGDVKVLDIGDNSVVCKKGTKILTLKLKKDDEE